VREGFKSLRAATAASKEEKYLLLLLVKWQKAADFSSSERASAINYSVNNCFLVFK
jgi:hypothetical protein